jgi:DNA-binding response OmpR family regulator
MSEIKVLIVDDEIEFASALSERLELRGFNSHALHSGLEALAQLDDLDPDIMVLDLKMPDMNGLEVLCEVKAKKPAVEVIMLTGHGSTTSGIVGMDHGAFDYMMKPVDIGELVTKIKLAFEKKQQG